MSENESGLDDELSIPWRTLIAPSMKKESTKPVTPQVAPARIKTIPRKNFLLTLSLILPATSPKNE